jgi:sirohydrochlorin cobaltochelatase
MNGIIVLAHGSKRTATEATLDSLIVKVRRKIPGAKVVPAYLQFSGQDMETAVQELVGAGVDFIKVVPMFLFDGIHVTEDIPMELEKLRRAYPGVGLELTRHLGDDDRIAEIIADRIAE